MAKKKVNKTPTFYDISNILSLNATYNIIYGERSNGKTFAILSECIRDYVATGRQLAIIRRFDEDFRGAKKNPFAGVTAEGVVSVLTNDEYNSVYGYAGRWFLQKIENGVEVLRDTKPIATAFSLTGMEHDKGSAFPDIHNVFFDEFMTRNRYLTDEFTLFMNTLSTIARHRDDIRIFMAGNTVNLTCPHMKEMGITGFKTMKQGDLKVYHYSDDRLKVAIEYSDTPSKEKPSDFLFAFDNPRLNMITGRSGGWEIALYPKCPVKYNKSDIAYTYIIEYDGETLQCDIVYTEDCSFTMIHKKTTPLKDDDYTLVYNLIESGKNNHRKNIKRCSSDLEGKILMFFKMDKVFYQSNEVGELVRNYLAECK